MRFILLILAMVFLAGCVTEPAGATWDRQEETRSDGTVMVTEKTTFRTPDNASEGSTFAFPGKASGAFGAQHKMASAGSTWGQKSLYGVAIALFILGGTLIGGPWKHIKLGAIAGVLGIVLIAIAVTVDKFPGLIAYGLAAVVLGVGGFFGWNLWVDYREKKLDKGEKVA